MKRKLSSIFDSKASKAWQPREVTRVPDSSTRRVAPIKRCWMTVTFKKGRTPLDYMVERTKVRDGQGFPPRRQRRRWHGTAAKLGGGRTHMVTHNALPFNEFDGQNDLGKVLGC